MSYLAVINCVVLRPQSWLRQGLVLVQGRSVRALGRSETVELPVTCTLVDAAAGVVAGTGAGDMAAWCDGAHLSPPDTLQPRLETTSPLVIWPGSAATFACYRHGRVVWALQDGRLITDAPTLQPTMSPAQTFALQIGRFLQQHPAHRQLHYLGEDRCARRNGICFVWQYENASGSVYQASLGVEVPSKIKAGYFYWSPALQQSAADWCFYRLQSPRQLLVIPLRTTRHWLRTRHDLAGTTKPLPVPIHRAQAALPRLRLLQLEDS